MGLKLQKKKKEKKMGVLPLTEM